MKVTRTYVKACAAILISNLIISLGYAVEAPPWEVETVDGSGAAQYTSMKVDKAGNIHIAFIPDVDSHPLEYAFWDHSLKRWFTMIITRAASFCALTLDSNQRPRISFVDHGTGVGSKVRYAYWDGTSWKIQPISLPSGGILAYYTSIALDSNDNPFLSFYDYANQAGDARLIMRSVSWKENHWEVRVVDPVQGSGKFNSIAVDSTGKPHIAYANVKFENSGLRYASWNGKSWETEIIEGQNGPSPVYSVNMVLDSKDNPHIAYTDTVNRLVKYATRRAGKWETQVVGDVQHEAYPDRNGIALDEHGNPYISYFDAGTGVLRVVHRSNAKWYMESVDQNFAGFTSSVFIDHDTLWISYGDQLGRSLKVAHRPIADLTSSVNPPEASAGSSGNPK